MAPLTTESRQLREGVRGGGKCSFGLFNYDSFVSFWVIGVIWGIRELTAELMCFLLLALFLVPTLWGTLLCFLPCYGTDYQRHENHLYVDCPGVGQVARGLRTEVNKFLQATPWQ